MKIVPFTAKHLEDIDIQESQLEELKMMTEDILQMVENQCPSFTCLDDDGTVLFCGGIVPMTTTRACVWSYLSKDLKKNMVKITNACKAYFKLTPYRRLELHVKCDFDKGHAWARLLGFTLECERMRCFDPNGDDYALYAMVKTC